MGSQWYSRTKIEQLLGRQSAEESSVRVGPLVIGLLLIGWGVKIWPGLIAVPWAAPISLVLIAGGLAEIAWGLAVARGQRWSTLVGLLLAALGFAVWSYLQVYMSPYYGTDEIAFDQYAAHLLLHGLNPYVHSLRPALQRYMVPAIYQTYTLSGHAVSALSYPDLSFLLYVPFLVLGFHMQAAVIADGAAWVVTAGLMWAMLEDEWRWLSILFLSLGMFDNYVVGGVTDSLFLPLLLLVVWRWDQYGTRGAGIASWVGPIALGLAMSVKQTPWFVAVFILVALIREASRRDGARWAMPTRYVAVTAITFFAVNLPFIVWSPGAWLHGILLPLNAPLIPAGQGIVELSYLLGIGGGNLQWYTLASLMALGLSVIALVLWYGPLKRLWILLVPFVFFWATRSFASYLIDLFPVAIVGYFTVRPHIRVTRPISRRQWVLAGICTSGLSACVVAALATPAPLVIRILTVQSTGQLETIDRVTVQALNRSNHSVVPHFTINTTGDVTTFWISQGPKELKPGTVGVYRLTAPNMQSMPSITAGFRVVGFTQQEHPASSVSPLNLPTLISTTISPDAINTPVSLGNTVSLMVTLRNRYGQRVAKAGVPVALGQIVYAQNAIIPALGAINGHPEGQTPIVERTNRNGVARFRIRDVQSQPYPLYVQSYVSGPGHFPYGYSNILAINFAAAP